MRCFSCGETFDGEKQFKKNGFITDIDGACGIGSKQVFCPECHSALKMWTNEEWEKEIVSKHRNLLKKYYEEVEC